MIHSVKPYDVVRLRGVVVQVQAACPRWATVGPLSMYGIERPDDVAVLIRTAGDCPQGSIDRFPVDLSTFLSEAEPLWADRPEVGR